MQPLGRPPVPEEYTMQAVSLRARGTSTGSPVARNSSQRSAPASSALGGASVTRTVCTFVDARPPEAPSCRQIGYSVRSEEHTSELQSRLHLVCRLLLEKKKNIMSSLF